MKVSQQIIDDFTSHVLAAYPEEAVGVVAGGSYIRCENHHQDPEHAFALKGKEQTQIELEVGPIEAILHSHTYKPEDSSQVRPELPSQQDMIEWIADPIPWGIVATDGKGVSQILWMDDNERQPLLGRSFAWGVHDCFSIVRDYYFMEKGINLKNVPRAYGWEARGEDLFLNNFEMLGFRKIPKKDATVGDVILYQIKGRTPNHCAIITSKDSTIQQLAFTTSSYQSRQDWVFFEKAFLRYENAA